MKTKSTVSLILSGLIACVTGCGVVVVVQAPQGGNGGVIGLSGSGPGKPLLPPSALNPPPLPQAPSNSLEPRPNLPPPGTTTPPPSGANPSPAPSPQSGLAPSLGGSSGGTGGQASISGDSQTAGSISYNLIVPASYSGAKNPLLVVYSGTEGGNQMTSNLLNLAQSVGLADCIIAVLDGVTYYGNGQAGATALDDVRARYNIDNDRTYLLGESAGTSAAEQLGFHLRESYFAAYWANDINTVDSPEQTATQLGFAPWGNVGPGGEIANAQAIVSGMRAAGYRLTDPAPYDGPGSNRHGDPQQIIQALQFFSGKARQ